MARIEKTVFISYRRTDVYTALAVYENLKNQGYDVFFDYRSISSGDFEQIITSNIRARAHFILILTPTALDRCNEPGDWLRREIEIAIDEKRNIVPMFFKGFRFGIPSVSEKLTGNLKNISRYNGLNVHEDYFEEAMQRIRTQFLSIPLDTVLHPVSTEVRKVVREEQIAADEALRQKEESKELERLQSQAIQHELRGDFWNAQQIYYKIKKLDPTFPRVDIKIKEMEGELQSQAVKEAGAVRSPAHPPQKVLSWRAVAGIVGALVLIALFIWGGVSLWNNLSSAESKPTPQTSELGIGSTMTGDDDMTLLYVPVGEFTMGGEDGADSEKPIHTVNLGAFWIDQTEVTNAMYAECVDAGVCDSPSQLRSYTRDSYYGESDFDNYPVVYVSWNDASAYCGWAGRRLPTEAEWEKAARGDNAFIYPWGNNAPNNSLLNYNEGVGDTTEVGKYPLGVSPYGALDMAGNVWEWVEDWYDAYPGNTTDNSYYGTTFRVLRGGAWKIISYSARSAVRAWRDPMDARDDIGFRCAMDAAP